MLFIAADVEGRLLWDVGGSKVGRVTGFYRYPAGLNAPWGVAAVTRGAIRRSTHLVDLYDAVLDGDAVVVKYTQETIEQAPNYQAMIGDTLSDDHAVHVLAHYRGTMQPA